MTDYLWIAALLTAGLLTACSPPGCSTSTDPATCANGEYVNNYNRERQLQERHGTTYPAPTYNRY